MENLSVNKIGAFGIAQNPDVGVVNKNTVRQGVQALTTLRPPTIFVAVILFGMFRKLPFPSHLRKYFIKIGKIKTKIHEIGKIKALFGLGMTPI